MFGNIENKSLFGNSNTDKKTSLFGKMENKSLFGNNNADNKTSLFGYFYWFTINLSNKIN